MSTLENIPIEFRNLVYKCCQDEGNYLINSDSIIKDVNQGQKKSASVFEICKNVIKTKDSSEAFNALFLVKDVVNQVYSQQTFQDLALILKERFYVLLTVMKQKKKWIECGDILNKKCKYLNQEYLWGLRFFVLLVECFN